MLPLRLLFAPVLLLVSSTSLFCLSSCQIGDTLHVWAPSGLSLRSEGNFESSKSIIIPFGAQVVALAAKDPLYPGNIAHETSYPIFEGKSERVTLLGAWLKVNYEGHEGYVFDAFLSVLPSPSLQDSQQYLSKPVSNGLIPYLERQIGEVREISNPENDPERLGRIMYDNGIYLKYFAGRSTYSFRLIIPDVSTEEAFHLIYYFNDETIGEIEQYKEVYSISLGCGIYRIVQEEGVVIITGEFGC